MRDIHLAIYLFLGCQLLHFPYYKLKPASMAKEALFDPETYLPSKVSNSLFEFQDIIPEELPSDFPPMRDIHLAINLILGCQLLNFPYYKLKPTSRDKINKQIKGLLEKGFIKHSLGLCVVPILLTPKKDQIFFFIGKERSNLREYVSIFFFLSISNIYIAKRC